MLVGSSDGTPVTFAGVLISAEEDPFVVALPGVASANWPGEEHGHIGDATGTIGLDLVLSAIPAEAVTPYEVDAYTEDQLASFWNDPAHLSFGLDAGGQLLWPDFSELCVLAAEEAVTVGRGRGRGVRSRRGRGSCRWRRRRTSGQPPSCRGRC